MRRESLLLAAGVLSIALFSGCGGGGGGGDTTPPAAPVITSPVTGVFTNDTTPTFTGTAEADSTVEIFDATTSLGTCTATGGNWTMTPTTALTVGSHNITAKAKDAAGNVSVASAIVVVNIDTSAPAAPVISTPADGSTTNDTTPTLTGTAEAGATVEVFDGATSLGTCTATGGNWTFTPISALTETSHTFTAIATDAAGNPSGASTAVTVTIDATKPAAPVITSPTDSTITNDSTPTISGTAEADSTVEVFDGVDSLGTCIATGGNWTLTPTLALSEGAHSLTATATDAATNTSDPSTAVGITVDTVQPTAPGIPTDEGAYADATCVFNWTAATDIGGSGVSSYILQVATDSGFTAVISTQNVGNVTTYPFDATSQSGNTLYARVSAVDAATNTGPWSSGSNGVTIDTSAPSTPGACADAGVYDSANVTFTWTDASDFQSGIASYVLEVGTTVGGSDVYNANVGNVLTYDVSAAAFDGVEVWGRVYAINGAGMSGAYSIASDGVIVDASAPVSTVNTKVTKDNTPSLSGTVTDGLSGLASISVEVNAVVYTSPAQVTVVGNNWTIADGVIAALGDGYYDILVTAVDAVGNSGNDATTNELLVDTVAPGPPGTPTDNGTIDDAQVTFNWTAAVDPAPASGIQEYWLQVSTSDILPFNPNVFNSLTGSSTPTYTFDASLYNGQTLYAQVAAVDVAVNTGSFSGVSDGVLVDASAPSVWWANPDGWTNVGLAETIQIQFSEPMDQASVEAAFSMTPAAANGYIFEWSGNQVTITPDTADPAGITNSDILLENQLYSFVVASTAVDLAGNALQTMTAQTFTTRDQTPPELISAMVNTTDALLAPVDAADVIVGGTIVLKFDETMDQTRGRVSISTPQGDIEAYYDSIPLQSAVRSSNVTTYQTSWNHNLTTGDTVTVTNVWPNSFNTSGSVTVIDPTNFSLPNPGPDESANPFSGQVSIPGGYGASIAWTSATELTLTLGVALSAGVQYSVSIWDVSDLSWNSIWNLSFALQVEQSSSVDTTPPVLIATIPTNGLSNIDRMMVVMLTFNEPIAKDTLDNITIIGAGVSKADFTLSDGSGEGGGDTQGGYVYTYEPKKPMPANTPVTVTVPVTVTDLAGNALSNPIVYTFTTTAVNETGAPTIDATIPSDGELNAAQWGDITVSFKDSVTNLPDPIDEATLGLDDISVHDDTDNVTLRGWTPSLDYKYTMRISNWSGPGLQQAHTYTVTIGPGISDIYGNAMAASETITFTVADVAENRSPTLDSLDIKLSGNTGPEAVGRELTGRINVRDEDNDPVDVTIESVTGGMPDGHVTITGTVPSPQNNSEFRVGGDGGPPQSMTLGMTDANYPTSGYYDFTITLDDGTSINTYTTKVWVWRPDATPQLVSVGGVAVSKTSIISITPPTNTPTFVWQRVDTTNADYIQLAIFDAGAIGGDSGPGSAYSLMFYLPASVTSYTIPAEMPMPTGIYLWTVIEAKSRPGMGDPVGQGWALDMLGAIMTGADLSPFFIYSPDAALMTNEYAVAEMGAFVDKEGAFDSAGDFNGSYTFNGDGTVDYDVFDITGTEGTGTELYTYDDPSLVVTRALPGVPSTSPVLPGRGWTCRSGNLILQTQSSRGMMDLAEQYVLAGAKRLTGTFDNNSLDGTWSFIEGEMDVTGGTFNGAYCNIGTAVCATGTATVTLKDLTGTPGAPPGPIPYTVTADGYVTLTVGTYTVSGYIGGDGLGSEILVMATDNDADRPFWIMMAKQYSLVGKTVADVSGTYNFVQLQMMSSTWDGAYTAWGTVTCNGAGNYTYQYNSPYDSGSGSNTYSVDGVAGEVVVDIDGGYPLHMYAGPDIDTLYGISMDAANEAVLMIIMSK